MGKTKNKVCLRNLNKLYTPTMNKTNTLTSPAVKSVYESCSDIVSKTLLSY